MAKNYHCVLYSGIGVRARVSLCEIVIRPQCLRCPEPGPTACAAFAPTPWLASPEHKTKAQNGGAVPHTPAASNLIATSACCISARAIFHLKFKPAPPPEPSGQRPRAQPSAHRRQPSRPVGTALARPGPARPCPSLRRQKSGLCHVDRVHRNGSHRVRPAASPWSWRY